MPLPDERPRQSVANLIGKFETHSKHLSPSQSIPSRSSSVVSHITGDSPKDEIREKREWPPRSLIEKSSPGPSRPIPLVFDVLGRKPFVKTEADDLPTNSLQYIRHQEQKVAQSEPNSFLENWRKDLPQPTEMEPELPTPKPRDEPPAAAPPQKVVTPPQTPKTPAMKTSKVPASTSAKSIGTSRSASKSTLARQSLTPATSAQSLRPQLTGQSVGSSKKPISKAPTTPKTPSRTETGTKTPTSTPRSKTPSAGLFAPTAASLAKARNALPPLPPLTRKTTISGEAMDRLSRPTAASLSRVKTGPAPAASTAKSPRMSSIRSKSTAAPAKSPQTKIKMDAIVPPGRSDVATVISVVAAEVAPEPPLAALTTNGHPAKEEIVGEVPASSEADQTHPEAAVVSDEVAEVIVDNKGAISSQTQAPKGGPEGSIANSGAEVEEETNKANLEDIVNLLETSPSTRPLTEEISEIPDEDDK